MGSFLDKPKTEKYNDEGSATNIKYAVSSMQGWRMEMEDSHCAVTGLQVGSEEWSYFAIFDGHAGAAVSSHCSKQLLHAIMNTGEFKKGDYVKALKTGFLHFDDKLRDMVSHTVDLRNKAGSTAVCAFVTPQLVYIANCGDSRAIISKGGKPALATKDHKPFLDTERTRIERAGGTVTIQRVNGLLAVSRALGDFDYKNVRGMKQCEQPVSPEPDIYVHHRSDEDEFLLLACDGIWDVMTNTDVCSYLIHLAKTNVNLLDMANGLVDTCFFKGSKDNMSVVLVGLPGLPGPCPETHRLDRETDNLIRKSINDILQNSEDVYFDQLMVFLEEENIPNLPSGGGLVAKRPLIESIYKEMCPKYVDESGALLIPSLTDRAIPLEMQNDSNLELSPIEAAQDASAAQHSGELFE